MNATPADQLRLLDVADLDARLAQQETARRTPPQAARVKELLTQRQALVHELSVREGARDDLRAELARVEADVKVVEARRSRDEGLLQTSSSAKDVAGIEHELASLARRQSDLEDSELSIMERLEEAEAAVSAQAEVVAQTNEEGARLSAEAKAVVAEATAEIERLTRDRDAVRASVAGDLLGMYDRLSARGTGAALLRARTCHGCHMVLSGTDLEALRQVPDDVVATCPECGCILVRTGESGL